MPIPKPRRYPWPASRIDRDIMHELHLASRHTGLPITHLIRDAVHAAMNQSLEQKPAAPAPIGFTPPASPAPAA
jgi:hypothetical protein